MPRGTSVSVDGRAVTFTNNHSADPTQNVNQYGQRTTPGYVDVTGWAPAASVVTANGQTASRQGDYFLQSLTFGTMPTWQDLTVNCDFGGSETRHGFLAANPETYTYDYDGNLTADGRWAYTWDAENRLVAMETVSAAYGAGVPRQRIEFKYDYMSRRVEKAVFSWNLSLGTWDLVTRQRYTYFGWNLIAEYLVLGPSNLSLQRSYTWGIDLGGVSAGGTGGLLTIRETSSGASYLPAYDGAGNLTALMDRSNGSVVAAYEYSPFGETIRATGSYAATNPFRSATKYTDTETGLVYYGYRYYSPSLGRFINRDPIGESGGLNLYGFVGNSPTNAWDVLGLCKTGHWVEDWVCQSGYDEFGRMKPCTLSTKWICDDAINLPPPVGNGNNGTGGGSDGGGGTGNPGFTGPGIVPRGPGTPPNTPKTPATDPNKEHPDCAGLRGRYAIAEKVLKDNGGSFAEGGRYADQIGLLDNISGTSGAAFVNTAAGVSLTYVGVRWAERAASLPAGNSIRNLGMAGLDFLATKAAILGIVYDVGNAVNSYANDRPLDAVQSGASGTLTATTLAIAQSNPYTAIAAGVGQVGIGAFEIGAQVYQNRVEEGRRLQSAQSSANLVSSAASKVNAIANEMREKGCK